jgi:methylglutamate dehydrogenase subunit D
MPDPGMRKVPMPCSSWEGIATPGRFGRQGDTPGLVLNPIKNSGLVMLAAFPGARGVLNDWFRAQVGFELPQTGRTARMGAITAVWSGPETWLLTGGNRGIAARADASIPGMLVDQSEARAIVQLSGARARDALAKGCMLDLHPDVFVEDATAMTTIAHINVQIWREGDAFMIAAPRSMGSSFWSWLMASAAEFGVEIQA